MFNDAKELASSLARIYSINTSFTTDEWPNITCEMRYSNQSIEFNREWGKHHKPRSSFSDTDLTSPPESKAKRYIA